MFRVGVHAISCLLPRSFRRAPVIKPSTSFSVFVITREDSSIKFFVKSLVALAGDFEKWDATLTFTSPDVATGVLDVKVQAASMSTGSGTKDGKLKSRKFFDVEQDPLITFASTKIVPVVLKGKRRNSHS
jgi:polyisoprenoid-binding protein YceI